MLLLQRISAKRFLLALIIVIILTGISYLSMLGSGKGLLPYLFLIFRFPTHTLFWDFFSDSSTLYRLGLVINIFFWSIVLERLFILLKRIFTPKLREFTEEERTSFMEKYDDQGLFTYKDEGFIYLQGNVEIKWQSIKKVVAFKRDLITYDLLCLIVYFDEMSFEISEETPGWYQFHLKLREAFPSIPERWESNVLYPPFATNETILYEK